MFYTKQFTGAVTLLSVNQHALDPVCLKRHYLGFQLERQDEFLRPGMKRFIIEQNC